MIRVYSPQPLNDIINHPDVLPFVTVEDIDYVDMSFFFESPENVCLLDEGGGFICVYIGNDIYEVHSHFLPEYRGLHAIRMAKESIAYMKSIGAKKLIGYTPVENRAARRFNRLVGMKVAGLTVKQFAPDGPAVDVEECYMEFE